jgi:hypothetical protein
LIEENIYFLDVKKVVSTKEPKEEFQTRRHRILEIWINVHLYCVVIFGKQIIKTYWCVYTTQPSYQDKVRRSSCYWSFEWGYEEMCCLDDKKFNPTKQYFTDFEW